MTTSEILCDSINAEWDIASPRFPVSNSVDVWQVSVNRSFGLQHSLLSSGDQLKAARFLHEKDRSSFITRRIVTKLLLARYLNTDAAGVCFGSSLNKKPVLAGRTNIHFNISHSSELILIAVSDHEVGIDVERLDPDLRHSEIAENAFSEDELEFYEMAGDRVERFYRMWTRKESLLKAVGKGINNDLKLIPSMEGSHQLKHEITGSALPWRVSYFEPREQYAAAVTSLPGLPINFFKFNYSVNIEPCES